MPAKVFKLPVLQTYPNGANCGLCTYRETGVKLVSSSGSGNNGVCLVGDSPWTDEVTAGSPFSGASGRWLDNILAKRGLDRSDFTITNTYWCKPPALGMNDDFKNQEAQLALESCRGYLDRLVEERKPKVLVALGKVALKRLTGFEEIDTNHGYVFPTQYGIPCVPTFHPSGILQGNHKLTIAFVLGIARALEIANGSYKETPLSLVEDPSPSYIRRDGNTDIEELMVDIETPNSAKLGEEEADDDPSYQIIRMGFGTGPWKGVSFPFDGDYIERAKVLVKRARVLIFWNADYDLPRLRAAGFQFHPNVKVIDAMWAWHFLQSDLRKALAFAAPFFYSGPAWKHLSSQRPAYYNACDNAIQMGVFHAIRDELKRQGRWDRFLRHCVDIHPIYKCMGDAGVKVDKVAREAFMGALKEEAVEELKVIQGLVPASLLQVKESKREYKPSKAKNVTEMGKAAQALVKVELVNIPALTKDGATVQTIGGQIVMQPIYRKTFPFNPNSSDQIIELMKHYGVKVPHKRGESDKETSEAKYLKRIGKKFDVFRRIVNFKQRTKLISTYNWPLDEQDRAHTTYGFHPSTWRSSSRNVNLGNIPKREKLAKLFRRLLIAERGYKLIEIDRAAIEAVLVGYWAKSPEYISLAKAGVHDWLASYMVGEPVDWSLPFKELKAQLKEIKRRFPEEREAAKRCIHGTNYLLSAYGMHDEYEEYFPTEYSAKAVQDIYLNSPAGLAIRAWHKATLDEVWDKKVLRNSFEYWHYFYSVYRRGRKGQWEIDTDGDAKRAIAFRPQSDAAAIQREDILNLCIIEPWITKLIRLPTYDSLVLEAPNHCVDKCIHALVTQFSKPIPELNGLEIGYEVKVGDNLGDMEVIEV